MISNSVPRNQHSETLLKQPDGNPENERSFVGSDLLCRKYLVFSPTKKFIGNPLSSVEANIGAISMVNQSEMEPELNSSFLSEEYLPFSYPMSATRPKPGLPQGKYESERPALNAEKNESWKCEELEC